MTSATIERMIMMTRVAIVTQVLTKMTKISFLRLYHYILKQMMRAKVRSRTRKMKLPKKKSDLRCITAEMWEFVEDSRTTLTTLPALYVTLQDHLWISSSKNSRRSAKLRRSKRRRTLLWMLTQMMRKVNLFCTYD